jgi:hypothetical protein
MPGYKRRTQPTTLYTMQHPSSTSKAEVNDVDANGSDTTKKRNVTVVGESTKGKKLTHSTDAKFAETPVETMPDGSEKDVAVAKVGHKKAQEANRKEKQKPSARTEVTEKLSEEQAKKKLKRLIVAFWDAENETDRMRATAQILEEHGQR